MKAVVLDVESGQWKMVRPAALEDERLSAKLNRESSDQKQVARLKEAGYRGLVASIVESCGG